jgi:hypothetical protein
MGASRVLGSRLVGSIAAFATPASLGRASAVALVLIGAAAPLAGAERQEL